MTGQEKPIVVVVGPGSKQGSSVVCSLLQTGAFRVKALTKKGRDDPRVQDLAKRGAQLVHGDAAVSDELAPCFKGAFGVFAMTFGAPLEEPLEKSVEAEFAVGKAQADAAAAAGVKMFVFSTLEDVDERSKGKYHVPYFTAKARVQGYVTSKYPDMTSVFPSPAYFMTNFIQYYRPKRVADGTLVYSLPLAPDARVPFVNPYASVGPVVAAAMQHPETYAGQFIPVWDEQLTPTELVATFAKVTGKPAKYVQASKEAWFARPAPRVASQVVWDGYKYAEELGYYTPERDMQLVRKIIPTPYTWAAFLQSTGFDGSQTLEEVADRLWCRAAAVETEE